MAPFDTDKLNWCKSCTEDVHTGCWAADEPMAHDGLDLPTHALCECPCRQFEGTAYDLSAMMNIDENLAYCLIVTAYMAEAQDGT